uniref:Uncharacterized protein n=1 Tax=Rhizophora mucronata TaxID=61149 RepID=A0A2P2N059_RHIMU
MISCICQICGLP